MRLNRGWDDLVFVSQTWKLWQQTKVLFKRYIKRSRKLESRSNLKRMDYKHSILHMKESKRYDNVYSNSDIRQHQKVLATTTRKEEKKKRNASAYRSFAICLASVDNSVRGIGIFLYKDQLFCSTFYTRSSTFSVVHSIMAHTQESKMLTTRVIDAKLCATFRTKCKRIIEIHIRAPWY